jgi:hypothetical protein
VVIAVGRDRSRGGLIMCGILAIFGSTLPEAELRKLLIASAQK